MKNTSKKETSSQLTEDQLALKENEKKYRLFIELTGQIVWVTNASGEVVEDVPYLRKFTGMSYEETKGSGWTTALHPDDVANTLKVWNKAVSTKSSYETEYRMLRHDGKYRYLLAKGTPVLKSNGDIDKWVGVCIDITDRKNSELMLREEKERIRFILDMVGEPIFVKDNDHRITLANNAFYDIFNLKEKDVIGYTLVEAVPENERDQFLEVDRRVLDTGIPDIREEKLTVKNFTRSIITRKSSFIDDSGKKFLVGSIHDITDRVKAEEQLLEFNKTLEKQVDERTKELNNSKKLLEETGRLARVGGWEMDLKKNTLYWSEATHRIHEVEPGYIPDLQTAINFYAPEAIPVISKCIENAIANGDPFDVELQLITAKNNRLWVRAIGEVYKEDDKVIKVGGVFQDINSRKIIEHELEDHHNHLEQLVAERTTELNDAVKNLERSNNELETFNKMAVGREKRMIELKREVNILNKELGKEEPYDLTFANNDSDPKN